MSKAHHSDAFIWGLILITIGVIFLLNNLEINVWRIVANFWPLILIVWGARKLYFGLKERKQNQWPASTSNLEGDEKE